MTAGNNADCSGVRGSLRLGARLLRLDRRRHVWHTVKTGTRAFRHLNGSRDLEIVSRCVATSFRAVFSWVLRDGQHRIVARKRVRTGKLVVTSPNCAVRIVGPGRPPRAHGLMAG